MTTSGEKISFIWLKQDWFYAVPTIQTPIQIIQRVDMPYHRLAWISYTNLENLDGKNASIGLSLNVEICVKDYKEIAKEQ